jgi:hypothetical protein
MDNDGHGEEMKNAVRRFDSQKGFGDGDTPSFPFGWWGFLGGNIGR